MIDRPLRRIFILVIIALLLWLIYLLKPVVIPFVGAFFIAYLFSPLVARLSKLGLPRWLSTCVVFLGISVGLTFALWYVVPLVWKQVIYARDSIPAGVHWVNHHFLPWAERTFNLQPMRIDTDQMSNAIMQYIKTNYSIDNIQTLVLRLAQSGLNFIQIGGTVVLIHYYFLLFARLGAYAQANVSLDSTPVRKNTMRIVRDCHMVLGAFVKGQILVMFLLGVVYAVGLQLIGLEVGLIIGMVAGLASIIPYLGFAVGIISAVIATLFQFGIDWMQLVLVGIVFMIGQAIEGYILQPFLLGDKIGLSPVAVVFAVLAGAHLGGILGMLIALPVAAIIVVLLKHAREFYESSLWYGKSAQVILDGENGKSVHVDAENINVDITIKISKIAKNQVRLIQNKL
jgi:predicted PurR-regulated permease PerM